MNIFITGARGFLGSNLIPLFKERGYNLILFEGDILKKEQISAALKNEKIDIVIHLAAKYIGKKEDIIKVNILGTKNLVEVSKEHRIKKIVFISSIRVLSKFKNPYGYSKMESEEIIKNSGISYVIIRPSLIYGKNDKKNFEKVLRFLKILPFLPVPGFEIQPVFVLDIAILIEKTLNLNNNQIINAFGKEIIQFPDFLKKIKKTIKSRCFIFTIPKFLFKIIAFLVPFRAGRAKSILNNEIFKSDLWWDDFNIKPVSIEDGIKLILNDFL